MQAYLHDHPEISITQIKELDDGRLIYILDECPFNPDHGSKGETCLIHNPEVDHAPSFKCNHNSCQDKGWRDFYRAVGRPSSDHLDEIKEEPKNRVKAYLPGRTAATFDLELLSYRELWEAQEDERFLVQDILVVGQPGLIGGASKTLKTSLSLDLAVSIASGTPFLGRYDVLEPGGVVFVSAESGRKTISKNIQAIAETKGLNAESDLPLYMSFKKPQLTSPGHLASIAAQLRVKKPKLLLLDPTYLLLGVDADRSKNVFAMGEILGSIADVCAEHETAVMLLHHVNKANARAKVQTVTLNDLAYAGFAEWARQWFFVTRTRPFEPGTNSHDLRIEVGNSVGHSHAVEIRIDEGIPMDPMIGRMWKVEFPEHAPVSEEKKAWAPDSFDLTNARTLFDLNPEGVTRKKLRNDLQVGDAKAKRLLDWMRNNGEIEEGTDTKGQPIYKRLGPGDEPVV